MAFKPLNFPARYAGTCKLCEETYAVGDQISKLAGGGYGHPDCRKAAAREHMDGLAPPEPSGLKGVDFTAMFDRAFGLAP